MSSGKFLAGKVALVTGSSRGIGASTALGLAEAGADVVINYVRSKGPAEEVAQKARALGVRAEVIQADVTRPEEIERLFTEAVQKFGRLDIAFANAGIESWVRPDEFTREEMDKVFGTNVYSQLFVAQQAYKHLKDEGRLILMSSIAAHMGRPAHAFYASSKAAIQGATRALAWDFGPRKITVNAVAPGGIKTDMYTEAAGKYIPGGDKMSPEEIDRITGSWSPLNRPGYPEDVVGAVLLLASPHSQWITGQTLAVCGGARMV
ncbi:hypothetical protein HDZ31DRAFT_81901 [Schizophyllum fasciatum]